MSFMNTLHTWTARSSVRPWRNDVHGAFNMIPVLLPSRNNSSKHTSLLEIASVSEDPPLCYNRRGASTVGCYVLRKKAEYKQNASRFYCTWGERREELGGREGTTHSAVIMHVSCPLKVPQETDPRRKSQTVYVIWKAKQGSDVCLAAVLVLKVRL